MDNRVKLIQNLCGEMDVLITEKNRTSARVSNLMRRVKKELEMHPADFMLAVRMKRAASARQEEALNTVREVMTALGAEVSKVIGRNETITDLYRSGLNKSEIARKFGITSTRVGQILRANANGG